MALSASVHALRGNKEKAKSYSIESYEYMVSMSGQPEEWQRNQFYCSSLPLQAEGEFAQITNKLEPALGLSGQPVKRGTMAHKHIIYMMLVDSAASTGDVKTILHYAPLLEDLAVRDDHQPYLAICHRAYGIAYMLTGKLEESESSLQMALKIFEDRETPWQSARTLYALGELANLRGQSELSREMYRKAVEKFETLQALPDVKRTKAQLEPVN